MVDFSEIKIDLEGMPDFYLRIKAFSSGVYRYSAILQRKGTFDYSFVVHSKSRFYLIRDTNIILFGDAQFNICKDCISGLDAWMFENEGRHLSDF